MTAPDARPQPSPLDNRDLDTIRKALDNARMHIDGTARWFSARNKGAVLWQLQQALEALDTMEPAPAPVPRARGRSRLAGA